MCQRFHSCTTLTLKYNLIKTDLKIRDQYHLYVKLKEMTERQEHHEGASLVQQLMNHLVSIANSQTFFIPVALLLLALDSGLSYVIINKIPCMYI